MYLNFKLPKLHNCNFSFRYYTVQYAENSGPWQTVPERVDPQVMSYTVTSLKPFTAYRFRIQATNDIGPSGWSVESDVARTLPAGITQAEICILVIFVSVALHSTSLFYERLLHIIVKLFGCFYKSSIFENNFAEILHVYACLDLLYVSAGTS
jgi:hypothetical protein